MPVLGFKKSKTLVTSSPNHLGELYKEFPNAIDALTP